MFQSRTKTINTCTETVVGKRKSSGPFDVCVCVLHARVKQHVFFTATLGYDGGQSVFFKNSWKTKEEKVNNRKYKLAALRVGGNRLTACQRGKSIYFSRVPTHS